MEVGRLRRDGPGGRAQRLDRLPLGRGRPRRRRQVESRGEGRPRQRRREAQALGARGRPEARSRRGRVPLLRRRRHAALSEQHAAGRAEPREGACRADAHGRRLRGAGRDRVRPAGRAVRHRSRAGQRRGRLQRQRALHAGLAGADHRRAARPGHHGRPPVRGQRRQDPRQVDDHHRRGDEPLVPRRHELPRRDQPADDVRLHRPERRRLGALRRAGEAAPADRLDARSPSRSTGSARRASRTRPRSSTRTPTSGATRSSASRKCCRRWPTARPSAAA